jgi:hypothetical protein
MLALFCMGGWKYTPWLLVPIGTMYAVARVGGWLLSSQQRETARRLRMGLCPRCGHDLFHVPDGRCPDCERSA